MPELCTEMAHLAVEQSEKVDSPNLVARAARLEGLLGLWQQPGPYQAALGVRANELGVGSAYASAKRRDGRLCRQHPSGQSLSTRRSEGQQGWAGEPGSVEKSRGWRVLFTKNALETSVE